MQEQYAGAMRLAPRPVLTGAPAGDSLQNVTTFDQADGCLCWVESAQADYRLLKSDNATPEALPNVVVPSIGPGRWFKVSSAGGGSVIAGALRFGLDLTPIGYPFSNPSFPTFHRIELGAIALDGDSVLFTSPMPGLLQYEGPTQVFVVHYDVNFLWADTNGTAPNPTSVYTSLLVGSATVPETFAHNQMSLTPGGTAANFHGDALITLAAKTILGVGVLFNQDASFVTETIGIINYVLIAR